MLEILQNFEKTTLWISPAVLLSIGLAAVVIGLILWLGGLNFKKTFIAVIAAVTGFTCGIFLIGANFIVSIIITAVAISAALLFERAFITILTALLIAASSFVVLSRSYIDDSISISSTSNDTPPAEGTNLSIRESIERVKLQLIETAENIKKVGSKMPLYTWAIIVTTALISIVIGFFFRHITSAFCCSALGTMSIFAGMITLFLFKGAQPISGISYKPLFYLGVFVAMTAFGTFEQLILCQPAKTQTSEKNRDSKDKQNKQRKN